MSPVDGAKPYTCPSTVAYARESAVYIFAVLSGIFANISSTGARRPCFARFTITGLLRLIMSGSASAAPAAFIFTSLSVALDGSGDRTKLIPSSFLILS